MRYFIFCKKKFYITNPYLYAFVISFVFMVLCIISSIRVSILKTFTPVTYSSEMDVDNCYKDGNRYVNCKLDKLYYTGYDYINRNRITGHYYYTINNDRCTIYLLSSDYVKDSQNPPSVITDATFSATLKKNDNNFKTLLEYMSTDLNWNYAGLLRHTKTTIISEYNYNLHMYVLLAFCTLAAIFMTLITAILLWEHHDYKNYARMRRIAHELNRLNKDQA